MKTTMKKLTALLLCACVFAATLCTSAFATDVSPRDLTQEETLAGVLKTLGLFKGVSETDYALERVPTRTEALVMLVRLLDKEADALSGNWSHPFTDVAAWADPYVGYAYQNGLTNGVSANQFGTGDANAAMYLTFVLRALGYSDKNGEDFTWDKPFDFAVKCGIVPQNTDLDNFLRADVALVSYAALNAGLKDSDKTLADKLWSGDELDTYHKHYDAKAVTLKQDPITIVAQHLKENGKYDKKLECYYLEKENWGTAYLEYYPEEDCLRWRMQGVHMAGLLQNIEVPFIVMITLPDTSGVYEALGLFSSGVTCLATVTANKYEGGIFGNWYEAINDPNNVGRYFNAYTQIALEETWKILEENDIPVTPADFGFDNEALKK